jgi:hypothetical protein
VHCTKSHMRWSDSDSFRDRELTHSDASLPGLSPYVRGEKKNLLIFRGLGETAH